MRVAAVLNREGGTIRTADVERLCAILGEAFAGAGRSLECHVTDGENLVETLRRQAGRDDIDCIVAGGGDGTVSASAAVCWQEGKALGILPAGTMNFFARTLGIPLDLEEAAGALAGAPEARADIATANGRAFIHQYSVGMQPRMVVERERREYAGSRLGKILASARAALSPLMRPPSFRAVITADGKASRRHLSLLAVSANPHGTGHLPYPDTFDSGALGLYAARPLPPAAGLQLAADLTLGSWDANPDLEKMTAVEVKLEFPGHKPGAKALIDGEIVDLERRVEIRLERKALRVLHLQGDRVTAGETVGTTAPPGNPVAAP
ncbi:MAG: diacylglycerol kinase [Phyllobacteriaceae bacterium]|nr:diacylglycerol kinase [Phyllobacteriaceae bacterium]MBA90201.1 diacylglycerol kinase [Phyllobacteriaceae bacterium]